jgi:hypothetical protein
MRSRRFSIVVGAALALALALPAVGRADDKGKDQDKDNKAPTDVVVHFGQRQPQGAPAAVTHFLDPDDITIRKGGSVTFVVNGGGHGIAIHPVSKKTTREEIAEDLCQGPMGTAENDRLARSTVCNGVVATPATVDGVPLVVVGTQNLDYFITDGKEDLIIHTGFNAGTQVNPRVDDTEHTHRLLGTSGRVRACGPGETEPACDSSAPGANPAGAFLTGTAPPATPGNRIQVQFLKSGRYLVICMNRAHSLNDHMFGFVNVGGDDDDK